jgi:hypothetical protein
MYGPLSVDRRNDIRRELATLISAFYQSTVLILWDGGWSFAKLRSSNGVWWAGASW